MKTYDVHKYPVPGTLAERIEVKPGDPLRSGWERMTEDDYNKWLAEQPPMESPAPAPEPTTLEDRLAALETKQVEHSDKIAALETKPS